MNEEKVYIILINKINGIANAYFTASARAGQNPSNDELWNNYKSLKKEITNELSQSFGVYDEPDMDKLKPLLKFIENVSDEYLMLPKMSYLDQERRLLNLQLEVYSMVADYIMNRRLDFDADYS